MPLRARLDSACAVALAVDRRYRTMNSELWQLIPDRWLLSHLHAAPSSTTRHRQGEWSRAARISGGRPCVGRLSDRTTRSSAPLHAERRAEGALPLPVGCRKKSVTVENFRVPLFLRTDELHKVDACAAHSQSHGPYECAPRSFLLHPWPTGGWRCTQEAPQCEVAFRTFCSER